MIFGTGNCLAFLFLHLYKWLVYCPMATHTCTTKKHTGSVQSVHWHNPKHAGHAQLMCLNNPPYIQGYFLLIQVKQYSSRQSFPFVQRTHVHSHCGNLQEWHGSMVLSSWSGGCSSFCLYSLQICISYLFVSQAEQNHAGGLPLHHTTIKWGQEKRSLLRGRR